MMPAFSAVVCLSPRYHTVVLATSPLSLTTRKAA
jgi:hypothetical protein